LNVRAMLSGSWCGLLSDQKARATIKSNSNVSLSCLLSGRKGMFDSLSCLLLCPYGHHPLKGMNQNDDDDLDEVSCCGIMVVNGSHHDASKAERDASLKYSVVVGVDDQSHRGTRRGNACCCRYWRRLPEEATGGGNDNNKRER
jgi:hypothetical protein